MSDSVMVALMPITTDWSTLELPHLTLVYSGKVDDHRPTAFNELAKDASGLAMLAKPLILETTGLSVFGDGTSENPRVDVFTIRKTSELMAMRNFLESWDESEFDFNPHVTIGPQGSFSGNRPPQLVFDRVLVGWGDQYLTFNMRRP